jgi:hypothetical protein
MLVPSLTAFIASLIAVSRNWHLQTNLKGLLWTGAALIFLVMLLFTRQVANIKVLDEVEIGAGEHAYIGSLRRIGDSVQLASTFEIDTENQRIQLTKHFSPLSNELREKIQQMSRLYTKEEGHYLEPRPRYNVVSYRIDDQVYTFKLMTYYLREKVGKSSWTPKYEKTYLCSYQLAEGIHRIPVSALELSDCIDENRPFKAGLRRIGDKLIVFVQDSIAVVQIKQDGKLEIIDKQINGLKGYSKHLTSQDKVFKIPLIAIPQINMKDRVKLTIDVNYWYYHIYHKWRVQELFYNHTLVDMYDDEISFCILEEDGIQRYDVVKWDEEYIYCKFRDGRQFTFLEQMFGQVTENDSHYVQNGKLYAYENQKLMVFDVASDRIRKLGHFERLSQDYSIQGIEVLDNGNILLCAETEKRIREERSVEGHLRSYVDRKGYLSLLKNPE